MLERGISIAARRDCDSSLEKQTLQSCQDLVDR
jgi:hypothetical protein